MQIKPIDILPCRKANAEYKNIRAYLNEFMRLNVKYGKVEYGQQEFRNVCSANGSFNYMIRRFNYPIRTTMLNGELYLVRTDMEG